MGKSGERSNATLAQLLDGVEELFSQRAALGLVAVLVAQQLAEGLHLVVERCEGGMGHEELVAALALAIREALGMLAHRSEAPAVVLKVRNNGAHEGQEVVLDEADDMEAVRHNAGPREVALDQCPVGAAEVDADHPDPLPPL